MREGCERGARGVREGCERGAREGQGGRVKLLLERAEVLLFILGVARDCTEGQKLIL